MTVPVVFSIAARTDLLQASAWYANEDHQRAEAFRAAVERRLRTLGDFPESCKLVTARHRRATLKDYPHLIFYRLDGTRVFVVAIFHARRDPAEMDRRLQDD